METVEVGRRERRSSVSGNTRDLTRERDTPQAKVDFQRRNPTKILHRVYFVPHTEHHATLSHFQNNQSNSNSFESTNAKSNTHLTKKKFQDDCKCQSKEQIQPTGQ